MEQRKIELKMCYCCGIWPTFELLNSICFQTPRSFPLLLENYLQIINPACPKDFGREKAFLREGLFPLSHFVGEGETKDINLERSERLIS